MSMHHGSQVFQGGLRADSHHCEVPGARVSVHRKLSDAALFVEEVQVLIVVAAYVLNERSLNGQEDSLNAHLLNGCIYIFIRRARHGDASAVAAYRGSLHLNVDSVLVTNAANLCALSPK